VGFHPWPRGGRAGARGVRLHGCVRSLAFHLAVEFGLDVLLALDFNGDEFLCAFFWVHIGWRLSAGDVFWKDLV